jgi:hypothetical protein
MDADRHRSSALLSPFTKLAQYGFAAPAPFNGVLIGSPAESTTRTSTPPAESYRPLEDCVLRFRDQRA